MLNMPCLPLVSVVGKLLIYLPWNARPVKWSIMSAGIEETVPLELYAPEKGARLISGIGDYGGFTHFDLNRPDSLGSHANPHFGNTNGVTGAWLKQDLIVRVGTLFGHQPGAKTISYSEDGGRHWTMCATVPTEKSRNGHIAVAADGSSWIWTPDRSEAYLTRDKGLLGNLAVVCLRISASLQTR